MQESIELSGELADQHRAMSRVSIDDQEDRTPVHLAHPP